MIATKSTTFSLRRTYSIALKEEKVPSNNFSTQTNMRKNFLKNAFKKNIEMPITWVWHGRKNPVGEQISFLFWGTYVEGVKKVECQKKKFGVLVIPSRNQSSSFGQKRSSRDTSLCNVVSNLVDVKKILKGTYFFNFQNNQKTEISTKNFRKNRENFENILD